MAQKPKRLTPKPETLKALYLRSGNCCAFPECDRRILNLKGEFIAQICHIEAAMTGGERFNDSMTNEERRSLPNLMLLCGEHHVVTNDVKTYTVAVLQRMKADHEAIFSDPIQRMTDAFTDTTVAATNDAAVNLQRLNAELAWGESQENLDDLLEDFDRLGEDLKNVPNRSRQILSVIVRRGKAVRNYNKREFVRANYVDIREALQITNDQLKEQLQVLEEHKFIADMYEDEGKYLIETRSFGWELWSSLKEFCGKTKVALDSFLVDGKFDQLDQV